MKEEKECSVEFIKERNKWFFKSTIDNLNTQIEIINKKLKEHEEEISTLKTIHQKIYLEMFQNIIF